MRKADWRRKERRIERLKRTETYGEKLGEERELEWLNSINFLVVRELINGYKGSDCPWWLYGSCINYAKVGNHYIAINLLQ